MNSLLFVIFAITSLLAHQIPSFVQINTEPELNGPGGSPDEPSQPTQPSQDQPAEDDSSAPSSPDQDPDHPEPQPDTSSDSEQTPSEPKGKEEGQEPPDPKENEPSEKQEEEDDSDIIIPTEEKHEKVIKVEIVNPERLRPSPPPPPPSSSDDSAALIAVLCGVFIPLFIVFAILLICMACCIRSMNKSVHVIENQLLNRHNAVSVATPSVVSVSVPPPTIPIKE